MLVCEYVGHLWSTGLRDDYCMLWLNLHSARTFAVVLEGVATWVQLVQQHPLLIAMPILILDCGLGLQHLHCIVI